MKNRANGSKKVKLPIFVILNMRDPPSYQISDLIRGGKPDLGGTGGKKDAVILHYRFKLISPMPHSATRNRIYHK